MPGYFAPFTFVAPFNKDVPNVRRFWGSAPASGAVFGASPNTLGFLPALDSSDPSNAP